MILICGNVIALFGKKEFWCCSCYSQQNTCENIVVSLSCCGARIYLYLFLRYEILLLNIVCCYFVIFNINCKDSHFQQYWIRKITLHPVATMLPLQMGHDIRAHYSSTWPYNSFCLIPYSKKATSHSNQRGSSVWPKHRWRQPELDEQTESKVLP